MSQNELQNLLCAALSSGAMANTDGCANDNRSLLHTEELLDNSAVMTPAEIISHYDFRVVAMRQTR